MTAHTKVSAKGQVVIPKGIRDQLAWPVGTALDVVLTADGITLRRTKAGTDQDLDAAIARLQATVNYQGPPMYDDDWNAGIAQMFAERGRDG